MKISLFSLPPHIQRINNYLRSVQKQNQSLSQHSCINNVSYVYIMRESRGCTDRSCLSVRCMCEVMCCDQRNSALTWPAVSHSWSFTGLPSTATTAAEKKSNPNQRPPYVWWDFLPLSPTLVWGQTRIIAVYWNLLWSFQATQILLPSNLPNHIIPFSVGEMLFLLQCTFCAESYNSYVHNMHKNMWMQDHHTCTSILKLQCWCILMPRSKSVGINIKLVLCTIRKAFLKFFGDGCRDLYI